MKLDKKQKNILIFGSIGLVLLTGTALFFGLRNKNKNKTKANPSKGTGNKPSTSSNPKGNVQTNTSTKPSVTSTQTSNSATVKQFDDLVNIATSKGADLFQGSNTNQMKSFRNDFVKNLTNNEANRFISLVLKGEHNWSSFEKSDFIGLFKKWTGKNIGGGTTGSPDTSIPTNNPPPSLYNPPVYPFTNTTDGNRFRAWVNDNYQAYAKSIQLDRTGSYNNSYIKKAFAKYGQEYLNSFN